MSAEGGKWLVVDPDGVERVINGSLFELCEQHERAACILAGCPDAFAWTLTDLKTGRETVPERIDRAVRGHLH
jgi:hypothetical protein